MSSCSASEDRLQPIGVRSYIVFYDQSGNFWTPFQNNLYPEFAAEFSWLDNQWIYDITRNAIQQELFNHGFSDLEISEIILPVERPWVEGILPSMPGPYQISLTIIVTINVTAQNEQTEELSYAAIQGLSYVNTQFNTTHPRTGEAFLMPSADYLDAGFTSIQTAILENNRIQNQQALEESISHICSEEVIPSYINLQVIRGSD